MPYLVQKAGVRYLVFFAAFFILFNREIRKDGRRFLWWWVILCILGISWNVSIGSAMALLYQIRHKQADRYQRGISVANAFSHDQCQKSRHKKLCRHNSRTLGHIVLGMIFKDLIKKKDIAVLTGEILRFLQLFPAFGLLGYYRFFYEYQGAQDRIQLYYSAKWKLFCLVVFLGRKGCRT